MKNPKQQIAKSTCLLCGSEETEFNLILSTGRIVKAFGLCLTCRDYSISDIIEEICTQDSQNMDNENGA